MRGPGGEVTQFQSYDLQDHGKHEEADKLKGSVEYQYAVVASSRVLSVILSDPDSDKAIANLYDLIHSEVYLNWPAAKTGVTASEFKR